VFDVLYGHASGRIDRAQEESQVVTGYWLGALKYTSSLSRVGLLTNIFQGMQMFRFIFLARSWASDRLYLAAQLSKLGRKAEQQDNPFALIIYPEGTLVSKDTRPISKKYAEKMGIVSV
jgi:hypothetical protein